MVTPQSSVVPAIRADRLVKRYGRDVVALDGLSIEVEPGTVYGLLGPNGAGKSTTVKVLATLARPDAGQAWVAGLDVAREPDRVRRTIGLVAQRAAVDPEATGRENLVLEGRLHGMPGAALAARVDDLLERFGLTEHAGRIVRTYSGGMQRKLDVAMGLVHRPAVLFLDEPTAGLDPEARADLWAEIRRLTREDGLTILLTTHHLEEADRLARRLAIVDRGRVIAEGTPDALKAELRGDAVQVELQEPDLDGRAAAAMGALDDLGAPVVDGRSLRARTHDGARVVPVVLSALEGAGIAVASVTVARPSLDDVYLRHTGHTYRQPTEEAFA